MLLSNEFVNFINSQEPSNSVQNVYQDIQNLKSSLTTLKQEFANNLPKLFMDNNEKGMQRCIAFGKEIDAFILELESIGIQKVKSKNIDIPKIQPIFQNTEKQTIPIVKDIKLRVVSDNVCPYDNAHLNDTKTMYTCFTDTTKKNVSEKMCTFTYKCPVCNKYFINKDMLLTIKNLDCTNIIPIYDTNQDNIKNVSNVGSLFFVTAIIVGNITNIIMQNQNNSKVSLYRFILIFKYM